MTMKYYSTNKTAPKASLEDDIPAVEVEDNIYSLELFHGPTLAFKDVGARFMARLLQYFIRRKGQQPINVLVATSGDTGSAVANGFLGVEGIHIYVLYPKGKVSHIQESQFTTLGQNVTAIEINGVFDDCQALVKQAFMDNELNAQLKLTSANSINVARFLPQSFYYFYAYAQLKKLGKANNLVVSVPSGNFGNLCWQSLRRPICTRNGITNQELHRCQQCQRCVLQLSKNRALSSSAQQTNYCQRNGCGQSLELRTHLCALS